MMPAEENEDERYKRWPTLRDALSVVTILCSMTCRLAADTFVSSVEEYAWNGTGAEQLQGARAAFITTSQWELEVEPNPVKRSTARQLGR